MADTWGYPCCIGWQGTVSCDDAMESCESAARDGSTGIVVWEDIMDNDGGAGRDGSLGVESWNCIPDNVGGAGPGAHNGSADQDERAENCRRGNCGATGCVTWETKLENWGTIRTGTEGSVVW